ncbi:hypothetical protein SVIOM342S_03893 [Streptomyces violaceorubidus]
MPKPYDHPDTRWLGAVMHVAFFLLLGGALARFLLRHPGEPRTPWILALSLALAVLHLLGPVLSGPGPSGPAVPPARRRLAWLGLVVVVWMVLVVLAPSFAWCAVPLFYTGLRTLPARAALVLVTVLTVFVVAAQLRLAGGFDPNLLLAPPAVAAIAAAVFLHTERQAARQRALIDDLIRTRRELAASERREGTLAERQRLSMEIHDSLAQGLSSQRMLLQAAERVWEADPAKARTHVRGAASVAEHNLAEARRFVHDLAPADLARGGGLEAALRSLAARESGDHLTVRVHVDDGARSRAARPRPVGPAAHRPGRAGQRPGARGRVDRRAQPHPPRRRGRPGRHRRRARLRPGGAVRRSRRAARTRTARQARPLPVAQPRDGRRTPGRPPRRGHRAPAQAPQADPHPARYQRAPAAGEEAALADQAGALRAGLGLTGRTPAPQSSASTPTVSSSAFSPFGRKPSPR